MSHGQVSYAGGPPAGSVVSKCCTDRVFSWPAHGSQSSSCLSLDQTHQLGLSFFLFSRHLQMTSYVSCQIHKILSTTEVLEFSTYVFLLCSLLFRVLHVGL